ncbi:MAG: DUF2167 domain-containing protein [Verrucomicrobia bacterium]|nr:DUF2167 domain-containing protein [Verrucomicrobiota bacterium]
MTTLPRLAAVLCTLAIAPLPLRAAEKEDSRFTKGPAKVPLKDYADVQVPAGYRFADGAMVQEMMRSSGEPVSGRELGAIFSEAAKWFVVFLFDEVGYVKDDEKNQLDADKLLKTIKSNNDAGNEYRKKNGVAPLNIIGWEKQPAYDEKSHNLEWAIRAESEGRLILNYNVRVLGRKGVMEVILVVPPEQLTITLPAFRTLLEGHQFKQGQRYAEYKSGDKVAQYGLAALVTGAGAAVAAKLGFFGWLALMFKKVWKLVVVVVVAIGAFIKRIIFGRERELAPPPPGSA